MGRSSFLPVNSTPIIYFQNIRSMLRSLGLFKDYSFGEENMEIIVIQSYINKGCSEFMFLNIKRKFTPFKAKTFETLSNYDSLFSMKKKQQHKKLRNIF